MAFNENLGNFLTEGRNKAIEELKIGSVKYSDWKIKQDALHSEIVSKVGEELFDEYIEAANAAHSMEINTALLFGATIYTEIGKRFDTSTLESKEFAESFVG